jgi:hypothetical protein
MLEHGRLLVDGAPIEAIRTFRDKYAEEPLSAESQAPARQAMTIGEVRVLDSLRRPAQRFRPGDGLVVEMDVDVHDPTEQWAAGVALINHLDLTVFGTNSLIEGADLGPAAVGGRTVRFAFNEIPLVEGQYFVTVAVHPPVGPEWHRLDRTVAFRVYSETGVDGIVQMSPKIEVTP